MDTNVDLDREKNLSPIILCCGIPSFLHLSKFFFPIYCVRNIIIGNEDMTMN